MMDMDGGALWPVEGPASGEVFEVLASGRGARVERIVSAPTTEPGAWYDQAWDEWVAVLTGAATLWWTTPEGQTTERSLTAGTWVMIPAGCRHRVARVDAPTVWLAVHFGEGRV